jgi:hypothetical protein
MLSFEPDFSRQHSDRVWHVFRAGRALGLLTTWELALAAKHGIIAPSDEIWRDGLPRAFAAAEIDGLLPRRNDRYDVESMSERYQRAIGTTSSPRPLSQNVVPTASTGLAPLRTARQVPDVATFDPASSSTLRIADSVAHHIVNMLDRYDIHTVDDMTSDQRLRQTSEMTFDSLPFPLRVTLNHTTGRPFIEDRIFDVLIMLRGSALSSQTRNLDIRHLVLAQIPAMAASIDAAMARTSQSVRSTVADKLSAISSYLPQRPVGQPTLSWLAPGG